MHVSPALSLLQRVALDWDSLYLVQHWQPAVPVQSDELMLPDIGFSFYLFPIFVSFLFSPLSLSLFSHLFSLFHSFRLSLPTLHQRSTRSAGSGTLTPIKFLPDGSDGLARRTRHARRQGMGPTCLFRRSHGLWNGVVSVLWNWLFKNPNVYTLKTDAVNVLYAVQEKLIA